MKKSLVGSHCLCEVDLEFGKQKDATVVIQRKIHVQLVQYSLKSVHVWLVLQKMFSMAGIPRGSSTVVIT